MVLVVGLIVRNSFAAGSSSIGAGEEKTVLADAIASKELNKEAPVVITDENGEDLKGVKMKIDNVELRGEIIVKGQKATSVAGRGFLVVNIKLINELEQAVEIQTKDYFRLGENGTDKEWLAPDIHNDPVLVQAISTKPTRIAFPVNVNTRKFILQIGEITGNKEKVEVDL